MIKLKKKFEKNGVRMHKSRLSYAFLSIRPISFLDKRKNPQDKPDIKPFDEEGNRYRDTNNPPPQKKTKKFQGQGVIIGTKEGETNNFYVNYKSDLYVI